ncbi:MAG TPA: ankyrin repeat domain-containing protein [Vicinamibacterales bacterium]|nr:ankyrin repeat domain-containing protein [Vicinamibacterales bacterium]
MRRTLIDICMLGALALLPVAGMMAAAPTDADAVVDAAMNGNRDQVRTLLKDGADVNTAQADGMTALHWAAQKGDVELAKVLLYASANVRATTRIGGYTPLLIASRNGNAEMIEALLAGGADPNNATTNGTTALMLASAAGRIDAVKALLAKGANVNATENVKGETALSFAAAYGRADVVRVLTANHADVSLTTKVQDLSSFAKEEQERLLAERGAQQGRGGRAGEGRGPQGPQIAGVTRQYNYTELVAFWGGLSPLHLAARQGYREVAAALVDAGADVNQRTTGDHSTPLLVAIINGQFDLAKQLLDTGADPNLAQTTNGVTPLYAALNCQWSDKALYPQPRAFEQQKASYLDLMQALLDKGADPNARITRKVWYSQYDFDQSGVDESGATPFFRAAYAADVDGMKLLIKYGADPYIRTMRTPGRVRTGDVTREVTDVSPLPPVPPGGPAITALLAASGEGYGEGFAANHHHHAPAGMLPAVKFLVEEVGLDVNAKDHDGNTAVHNAAARGDNEMIQYLVAKGADVLQVNREGKTTVDMANGPVQRISPFPDTIKLLEGMGAKNNHKCVSC